MISKLALIASAALLGTALGAGSAGATTVLNPPYSLSDTSFGTGLGVHSNGTQTGMVLNAHVDQDGSAVTFESTDTLSQTGSGEATLNGPFDNLDVIFAKSWKEITFAFDVPNMTTADMSIFVNGSSTPIFDSMNCSICTLTSMGLQKFTIEGPAIDELKFTFSENIDDAKQFRVMGGIPEASTWAMMILGAAMVGFAARCRRRGEISLAAS